MGNSIGCALDHSMVQSLWPMRFLMQPYKLAFTSNSCNPVVTRMSHPSYNLVTINHCTLLQKWPSECQLKDHTPSHRNGPMYV